MTITISILSTSTTTSGVSTNASGWTRITCNQTGWIKKIGKGMGNGVSLNENTSGWFRKNTLRVSKGNIIATNLLTVSTETSVATNPFLLSTTGTGIATSV